MVEYMVDFFISGFVYPGILNYSIVPLQLGLFTVVHLEIYVALVAVLVTGGALRLRWRKAAVAVEI